MTSHRVFVYGSLLRGLHNHHRLSPGSDSTLISAAVTASPFVLVDSGSGYPYALAADRARSIDEPAQLKGELYEVTDELLHSSLDPLEGHPDYYRRGIIDLAEGLGQAALYLLHSEPRIREIRSDGSGLAFAPVAPAGDWRSHLASVRAAQAWPPTRDTVQSEGPHAVFSYGCNSLEELRERCSNPLLEAEAAELLGAMRVFGGASARWGGAVASVRPRTGEVVHGQVAWLSSAELEQLDSFEGTDAWSRERTAEPNQPRQLCRANSAASRDSDPYSEAGVYRRQDVTVHVRSAKVEGCAGVGRRPIRAMAYVKTDLAWRGPPSTAYLRACGANVARWWDAELAVIEVLDAEGAPRSSADGLRAH